MQKTFFEKNQIHLNNGMSFEKLRDFYEWIQLHTKICNHCLAFFDSSEFSSELKTKLQMSLDQGKVLHHLIFSEIFQKEQQQSLPLSGKNRFAENCFSPSSHELSYTKNLNRAFQPDLGNFVQGTKASLPSRRYLKKK